MNDIKPIMTCCDLQELLQCSKGKVLKLIHDGSIEYFIVGKKGIRVTREALEDYIKNTSH